MSIPSEYDFTKIPFDKINRVGSIYLLYRDLFTVSWLLGRYCNYKCSYCWTDGRSNIKDHRSLKVCIDTIDTIKKQARARGFNSFSFSLSGGEPTLHPHYLEIVKYLADDIPNCNSHSIHMTTNLSRNIKWLEEYANLTGKFNNVDITASYHYEHTNKEDFAKKIIMLQEYDIDVTINIVMVPEHFEKNLKTSLYFHDHGINVTLKPQTISNAEHIVSGYTNEMLDILKKGLPLKDYTFIKQQKKNARNKRPKIETKQILNAPEGMLVELTDENGKCWYMDQAERLNSLGYNNFINWECSSGYRSIIIYEPSGSIKRSYNCIDEPLGNIETGFKLFDIPTKCITSRCVSSADSKIPKRKPGVKIPLFPEDKTYQK